MRALAARDRCPDRMHVLRYEDIVQDPAGVLGSCLAALGVAGSATLAYPSWNGEPLETVFPWGTIRTPTAEANRRTAAELSPAEVDEIRQRTRPLLGAFGYEDGP
jgi:hypothetical protein